MFFHLHLLIEQQFFLKILLPSLQIILKNLLKTRALILIFNLWLWRSWRRYNMLFILFLLSCFILLHLAVLISFKIRKSSFICYLAFDFTWIFSLLLLLGVGLLCLVLLFRLLLLLFLLLLLLRLFIFQNFL